MVNNTGIDGDGILGLSNDADYMNFLESFKLNL